jgi:hypothetical protein
MMEIEGTITTRHGNARCVAAALTPDNLRSMTTTAQDDRVVTRVTGTQLRSVIASVDDYLMNLAIAEDTCSFVRQKPRQGKKHTGSDRIQNTQR